jgi:hypothetical protein
MGHEQMLNVLQGATKWCEMHRETPTTHAHRWVAARARRWLFCCDETRVFRLRAFGRRGAAAHFSRRLHLVWGPNVRLDGHPE